MKTTKTSAVAALLGGTLESIHGNLDFELTGFAPLPKAMPDQISFFTRTSVDGEMRVSRAGLVIVPSEFSGTPNAKALLRVQNPYASMVKLLETLHLPFVAHPPKSVAKSAKVHPSAVVEGIVGENAIIGPGCVVFQGASVGEGTILEANVTLYPNVSIGKSCTFQAGSVIGSRGFGFYKDENGERRPVPHVSGVRIGDDCEFGANCVVAAGFLEPTTIGNRCHFDSFVQIGHNSTVGNNCYMASQSGLGGTTTVEDDCEFAGGAQIAGHLTIGKGAVIAAKAGVTKSVPAGALFAGFPAEPIERWRKGVVALRRLSVDEKGGKRE